MKLTLQQLEAHLWGAANILRGKTAGQDYKNYILSLMFYKRLCDQWECEAAARPTGYTYIRLVMYAPFMKRLQILIDEDLDEALEQEARRRGASKAALIRDFVRERLGAHPPLESDPLIQALGQDDFEPASVDDVVYG